MLDSDSEERRAVDFLPEIEPGLVPVRGDVVEVDLDEGPDGVGGVGGVAFADEVVGL